MARIDVFLKTIAKLGASGMTLRSDENIVLHFDTGTRHASQNTPHEQLAAVIDEACPADVQAALYMEQTASFEHRFGDVGYRITVTPATGSLEVVIEQTAAPRTAPAAAPEASPPAGGASSEAAAPQLADDDADFGSLVERNTIAASGEPPAAPSSGPPGVDPGPMAAERGTVRLPPPGKQDPAPQPVAPPARADPAPSPEPLGAGIAAADPSSSGLVERLMRQFTELGASDLHLSAKSPPYVRLHGEMKTLQEHGVLSPEALMAEIDAIMPAKNRQEFSERNDTDFAYEIPKVSRYRVNVFRDRHGPGTVVRAIPFEILTAEQLRLPREVLQLCNLTKGLVVVTGPTGSGKSTTLATLVDYINEHRSDHIITIEDPIEFVHENRKCLVNQREVRVHTDSFQHALRAALREDPDIVLVGEMRDLETIAIAVETAETGHLVFGTLHTTTAPSTVDRIIDQFPADRQEQIRQMLASSLKGVIAQTLCRKKGGGRVAAYEVLIANKAVANLIRERKTFQLTSLMQTGRSQGMCTINDSLIELVRQDEVEPMEAYLKAVDKTELESLLEREGHTLDLDGG